MKPSCKVPDVLPRFWPNLDFIDRFSWRIPIQISRKSLHWEPRLYVWTDGRTDTTKLIGPFRGYAQARSKTLVITAHTVYCYRMETHRGYLCSIYFIVFLWKCSWDMSVAAISCSPKDPPRRHFCRCISAHNPRCLVQLTFCTFGSYRRVRSAILRLNTAAFMVFWHELFSYIAQHVSTNK